MIKALLLDFDGLMFNTERVTFEIFKDIEPKTGIHFTEESFGEFIGRGSADPMFKTLIEAGYNFVTFDQYFAKMYPNEGDANMPGLKELITYAKENNYLLAVGSNSNNAHIESIMKTAGFPIELDCLICGHGKLPQKPAPDIYQICAAELGVKPEECLVLEDSIKGCQAGIAAGMITCFVEDLQKMDPEIEKQLDYHVHSLLDVVELLKGMKA